MIVDVYSIPTNETIGHCHVYKSELRAKSQSKTTFGKHKNATRYDINNSFIDAEVVSDNIHKSDFHDNLLCIRLFDRQMSMVHEVRIPTSYFIKHLLQFCEGNKIKAELAYVPKHGVILKSSQEYISWETEYLKEYTELGTRKSGSGLYNGKRNASKSDVMYFNDNTLIQYIGRYTVTEDITKTVVSTRSWQTSTTQVVIIPAGRYFVYVEKGLNYKDVTIKLTAAPRKLYAVEDLLSQGTNKKIGQYAPESLQPFFYDCLIGGFGRKKSYNAGYADVVPKIVSTSSYTTLTLKDIVFDMFKQQIRHK